MLTLQFVSALHFNYVLEWKFTADISAAVKVAGDYAKTHNLHLVGTDSTAIAAADSTGNTMVWASNSNRSGRAIWRRRCQ